MNENKEPRKKRLSEGIEIILDEAKSAASQALSGAENIGESLKETLQGALSARNNVVMVRLNKESLIKLDDLVESGIVRSRSEAAAFLIGEGVKARSGLYDRISEKTAQIRKTKEELRDLLGGDDVDGDDPSSATSKDEVADDKP
jgi:hypothetical protein